MRASRDVSERVRVTAARRVRGSASPSLYEAASYEKRSRSPLLPHQKPDARVGAMNTTVTPLRANAESLAHYPAIEGHAVTALRGQSTLLGIDDADLEQRIEACLLEAAQLRELIKSSSSQPLSTTEVTTKQSDGSGGFFKRRRARLNPSSAATKIQSKVRGKAVRKRATRSKQAATAIQKTVRGKRARRRTKTTAASKESHSPSAPSPLAAPTPAGADHNSEDHDHHSSDDGQMAPIDPPPAWREPLEASEPSTMPTTPATRVNTPAAPPAAPSAAPPAAPPGVALQVPAPVPAMPRATPKISFMDALIFRDEGASGPAPAPSGAQRPQMANGAPGPAPRLSFADALLIHDQD